MHDRVHVPQKAERAAAAPPQIVPLLFGTLQRKCACGGSAGAGGDGSEGKKNRRESFYNHPRRYRAAPPESGGAFIAARLDSQRHALTGNGPATASSAFFEPQFGHDFSKVRVYTDSPSQPAPDIPTGIVQRKCACGGSASDGGECAECKEKSEAGLTEAGGPAAAGIQGKLAVSQPGDRYEVEADQVADRVMRMTEIPGTSPKSGGSTGRTTAVDVVQRVASLRAAGASAPSIVHEVLRSPGHPLPASAHAFFAPRFGRDFSAVRVHSDQKAAESAQAVDAVAYTAGKDIVFAAGRYALGTTAGQRLIAHELAHVVQQGAAPRSAGSEPPESSALDGPQMIQRQAGGSGGAGSGTPACSIPPGCPSDFCTPMNMAAAQIERASLAPILLSGIAAKVSPRVVGLWNQYIFGGSPPQNLSAKFGADFTKSATTSATTDFLVNALKSNLESSPPTFPAGVNKVTVDLPSRIGAEISEIDDPSSPNKMDFDVIGEIPGNIAGGIGKDQTTCPVGAQPSPFNDSRTAAGTAEVTQNSNRTLTAVPDIEFTVQDTIDFCPGNCGAPIEQIATVPLSRWEATGISGDVPFTVEFPAPARSVTTAKITPPTPAPPAPSPPTAGPVSGEVTASALRIRAAPSTSSTVLGLYPRGSSITILCQTTGTSVEGNTTWDKTDRGFVSDQYVRRTGANAAPAC